MLREPDLEHEDRHQVPQIDKPEHRHRRLAMGCQIHLERPLWVPEVKLQRQRRDDQECERRQQRQPIGRFDHVHVEDAFE
jgi:hypothetical protein